MNSVRLEQALFQIRAARSYSLAILNELKDDEWFAMPGGVTHAAWQAGHLAMAQYRLCLDRIRGERPEDAQLISPSDLALFAKGSTPDADPTLYPTPTEILATLARVHEASLAELSRLGDSELDGPVLRPHPLFSTKIGSLLWCSRHEMSHAGQLGLLRRLLGRKPMW